VASAWLWRGPPRREFSSGGAYAQRRRYVPRQTTPNVGQRHRQIPIAPPTITRLGRIPRPDSRPRPTRLLRQCSRSGGDDIGVSFEVSATSLPWKRQNQEGSKPAGGMDAPSSRPCARPSRSSTRRSDEATKLRFQPLPGLRDSPTMPRCSGRVIRDRSRAGSRTRSSARSGEGRHVADALEVTPQVVRTYPETS